jgi:hypothetical protein
LFLRVYIIEEYSPEILAFIFDINPIVKPLTKGKGLRNIFSERIETKNESQYIGNVFIS